MGARIIKCPKCDKPVEEVYEIEKTGIARQYAWCPCGWGGSYPFQTKNPFTGKYAWEHSCEN
ncbi:hypothetical protein 10S9_17 [uncultured Caudovirales phage]|uniref:Uncharacterized protein n=1 Tax=uncultured Caudovirales phage TaxID=2100421 RepID=A0A2H4JDS9_9CAUD|nr:hypothetical protein 10S9_17 [uncultured Caudovirales phage]